MAQSANSRPRRHRTSRQAQAAAQAGQAADQATNAAASASAQANGGGQTWASIDTDGNGTISKTEAQVNAGLAQVFDQADTNKDGELSADEYKAYVVAQQAGAGGGAGCAGQVRPVSGRMGNRAASVARVSSPRPLYPCAMNTSTPAPSRAIGLVGFDGDDTLWKSEDYYRKAEQDYLDLLSRYVDVHDTQTARHLLEVQQRHLGTFGYGVKSMTLSMIEAAIDITGQRIEAKDIQRILEIGHDTLRHRSS